MRNRTIWKDHVLSETGKFKVGDTEISDVKTITPYGEVMQQGTMQDANHFNNIEDTLDAHETAINLLLIMDRNNDWKHEEAEASIEKKLSAMKAQVITKEFTNSANYPFNNSKASVPLTTRYEDTNYTVHADIISFTGNVGEVEITEKLTNGFKAAYTGSAAKAEIRFTVTGG